MKTMNRRLFVQTAMASLGSATLEPQANSAEKEKMIPIVDTHQHLWDLTKFKLPWITKDSPLGKSFVLSDYADATKGLNVTKSIYMEVDVAEDQQTQEVDYVTDICKSGNPPWWRP